MSCAKIYQPSDPKSALVLLLHCQSLVILPLPIQKRERQNKGLASCGASGLKEAWINLLGLIRWRTVSQRMTSLRCNAALCAGLYSSRPLKTSVLVVSHSQPWGLSQILSSCSLRRKQTAGECDWWKTVADIWFYSRVLAWSITANDIAWQLLQDYNYLSKFWLFCSLLSHRQTGDLK